jgi:putative DNA primase/helicase
MSAVLNAALDYARRGWPVFPCNSMKRPLTPRGFLDASDDEAQIRASSWDGACVAVATGKRSGLVVPDIDIRESGSGIDSLQLLGVNFHSKTLTAHTPSGGIHIFYQWPGYEVPCSAGKLGAHLDVRGDGGYIILPPGPGRSWDPHLGLGTPLAPMPEWMLPKEPEQIRMTPRGPIRPAGKHSPYAEGALRRAYWAIVRAPDGTQEATLNAEAFSLGTLVASGGVLPQTALALLKAAAERMPTYDRRRPWRAKEVEQKMANAFTAGLQNPRTARHG